jgi:hypothetical protein
VLPIEGNGTGNNQFVFVRPGGGGEDA